MNNVNIAQELSWLSELSEAAKEAIRRRERSAAAVTIQAAVRGWRLRTAAEEEEEDWRCLPGWEEDEEEYMQELRAEEAAAVVVQVGHPDLPLTSQRSRSPSDLPAIPISP